MKNSKWIWITEESKNNEYVEFLTTFDYKNGASVLKLSVDTEYALFVNGKYVTSGQYADFPWYKIYDEINVTSYLTEGNNEIRILVWFMGDNSYCHYVDRVGLRFELSVDKEIVATSSEATLCRPCHYLVSGDEVKKFNRQMGYSFVWAESEPEEYRNAVTVSGLPEELVKRPIANLQNLPFIEAKKQGRVYDLGAETVGYPYIELCAPKGERVSVSFSEWIKDDGTVPYIFFDGKYNFSFEIIGTGEWQTVFNPLRKLGCRYFAVSDNCEIRKIGLNPVRYPFIHRNYEIDNDLRRRIYDVSVKTLELCAFEHYWDCPWREQAFWTFDSRFQMRYGFTAFCDRRYQRAALELLSKDKRDDGLITMVVPSTGATTIPSFSMSYVYAMAEYIEETGDTTLAHQYFDKIKSTMHAYLDRMEDGLVPNFEDLWNFYEWKEDYSHVKDRFDSLLNLMTAYALDKLVYTCRMLEREEDAARYSAIKSSLVAAVRRRFFNEETGLFNSFEGRAGYSELANSLAVLSGAASPEEAARICAAITEKTIEMTETTLSMTALKYDALLLCDKEKYAEYILSDIDTTFGKMLDAGATSFWETVLGKDDFEGTGSLCHGWSALPVYYYGVLGVLKEKEPIKEKDWAMVPGSVIYDLSSDKYADDKRIFQGIPGIERTSSGRMFYAFYSGTEGEGAGNFVMLYKNKTRNSFDFEPLLVIEPPMDKCRTFDPCLWIDPKGRLWVFYAQGYGHIDSRFGVWCLVCEDPDADELKFSPPRRIANGIMMNKPTVLKNGKWLLPSTIWKRWVNPNNDIPEEQYSNVYLSDDEGESFRLIGHADYPKRTCDEHMIVELESGRLMMYIRGDKGGIGTAYSDDGGHTWYGEADYILGGPDSRFFVRRLKSGRLLMLNHHDYSGKRCNVKAMLSEDEGRSWQGFLLLDDRDGVAYPDAVEDENGNIYIAYDYNRTTDKELYAAVITEADILAGKLVTPTSRLRILINKATGVKENS